jgi:hypothetical protein
VSSEISARWFVPANGKAGERKAFAFSAKKTWRSKIKSDVAAIAGTKRDYNQIICVTNQFVPAKKSAGLQDELLKEHGIPVTILDRTWLLDRVFNHDSMAIAVEELGIGKGTEKQTKKLGLMIPRVRQSSTPLRQVSPTFRNTRGKLRRW